MAKEIHVLIDEGGIFQGCYVTPDIADAKVDLIDFYVTDENDIDTANKKYETVKERAKNGELKNIY
jgi:hypothetical protein